MVQRTLELFRIADSLQSTGDNGPPTISELCTEIFEQFNLSYQSLSYDDFMRMLVSTERIADFLRKTDATIYNKFVSEFFGLKTTEILLKPRVESPQSRFSSALLATAFNLVQKLDSEFFGNLDDGARNRWFVAVVSGLQLPNFFEAMREDEMYNKQNFNESLSKAKIFVPQAEKLWKILVHMLANVQNVPKDVLPDVFLLVGEYAAQYPCSWSSDSIMKSIAEIKNIFSKPPMTPSSVLGEHISKIVSIALKKKEMISCAAASWCLCQIEYPNLSLHPILIHLCINAMDNSEFKMKEIGFQTLSRVIQNVNAVELAKFQNEIYPLLAPYVTSREAPILTLALPLTLHFLQKCQKIKPLSQPTLDTLFSSFLLGINNTFPALCAAYTRSFPALLDLAGVHAVTYAAVLFPYLEGALDLAIVETLDKAILQDLLLMLKSLVQNCWPRVPAYRFQIFQAGVSGLVGKGEKCEESTIALANDILGMLKNCCGEEFKEFEPLIEEIKTMYPSANKLLLT